MTTTQGDGLQVVGKWTRLTGEERDEFCTQVAHMYREQDMSIREIGQQVGRSYGAVHRLLTEAGVTFRPRGNRAG